MNYIKQNIKYLRLESGCNQEEFGKLLGYSRDNIASYERGTEPKISFIMSLVNHFHISYDDFIGRDLSAQSGDRTKQDVIVIDEPASEYIMKTDRRVDIQNVPLYDIEAAAGLTQLFDKKQNVLDFIRIPNLPKCDGAVYIKGDSMYPLLKSGDIVMYKQVHDILGGIFWGEMYILSLRVDDEDLTLVKYIQKSDLGPDYIKLVSQNQHHASKDVLVSSIRALALIKASVRINSMS